MGTVGQVVKDAWKSSEIQIAVWGVAEEPKIKV